MACSRLLHRAAGLRDGVSPCLLAIAASSRGVATWLSAPSLAEVLEGAASGADERTRGGSSAAAGSVGPCRQPSLGDYACNVRSLTSVSSRTRATSADVAGRMSRVGEGLLCSAAAGHGGFVNVRLSDKWLGAAVAAIAAGRRPPLGQGCPPSRARVLVDCASPNVGKELHVGHLRSACVGDSLARVLTARGYAVTAVSHVGDSGMPVALVLWALGKGGRGAAEVAALHPAALSAIYRAAKEDVAREEGAGGEVAALAYRLHAVLARAAAAAAGAEGVPATGAGVLESPLAAAAAASGGPDDALLHARWVALCAASRAGYVPLFEALNVRPEEQGEACYAHLLPDLVTGLLEAGTAVVDDGAVAVFLADPSTPPLLARKRDGGYLYATTDLAALRARLQAGYRRIVYVTDAGQSGHFSALFEAAGRAGWTAGGGNVNALDPSPVLLEHAAFGVVTGPGGRKLSSRDGTDLTLARLLDEGAERMRAQRAELRAVHGPFWQGEKGESEAGALAAHLSASCARFYDALHARHAPYAFSFDAVLDARGRGGASATYLLYARTRLVTLRRVAAEVVLGEEGGWEEVLAGLGPPPYPPPPPASPPERALALAIVSLPDALAAVDRTLSAHHLARAALALAAATHAFYAAERVIPVGGAAGMAALDGEGRATFARRLTLAAAAERGLSDACDLLGLHVVECM
jgi:arginyl-tRNA synthetase